MKRIFEIDENFKVATETDRADAVFYDPRKPPFRLYGVFYENGMYRRLPEAVAKTVNEGVYYLHANTAGGRLRFRTDSPYVIVNAEMSGADHMVHFPLVGSGGFDLYADGVYEGSFIPPADLKTGYESVVDLGSRALRDITVHFPLYANVHKLGVGLAGDAKLLPGGEYRELPPIVTYGSSITQGGCASRPGNAYQNMLSRMLNADHLNLGFSGSARGEDEISAYIAGLNMSVFVLDYDHNAPTPAHLAKTHERLFRTVRTANPELPVIMLSRPKYRLTADEEERRAIVQKTCESALAAGDKNVYFLDGPALMATAKDDGTVDGCHPNDLGFYSMAQALYPLLAEILK